jgi:glycine cleavage system T protein (aminomethyltransferase)
MSFASDGSLCRTPLHRLHVELGARMVRFAGYSMPLQYPTGIIKEHLHTRAAAGLFDVSHMGQIALRPRSGRLADAAHSLNGLVCADICSLSEGRQRYALFTNASGGVIDDLMVANRGEHLALVVNASRKTVDEDYLRARISDACEIEFCSDRALIALQGPCAQAALADLAPAIVEMNFMDVGTFSLRGIRCEISRSGYTGEDGFELSVAAADAEPLARMLLKNPAVTPVGLGARDSLRLEAGLCLYGAELDEHTSPIEAGLEWSIQRSRRKGGLRCGGFPGAQHILNELENGPLRRRVGLRVHGRIPARAGAILFNANEPGGPIGKVSSGCFGPTVDAPVAMGFVTREYAPTGTTLQTELRGNRIKLTVSDLPLVAAHYKRK